MKPGWDIKNLGEVCEIFNGGTPDTKKREFWDGDILWITPKDLGKLHDVYVDDTERKITGLGLKNSSAKLLPINSVILSSRAPIGHLAINKKEIATNQGCKGLVPKRDLLPQYLFYYLKKSVDLLNNLGSGTTFKEISGSKLSEVKIPVPPLPEQRRIVAILDEAFAAIAKAKANTEKNLQNAREMFDGYLTEVFSNPGEKWEDKTFKEIALIKGGKRVPKGYRLETKQTPYPYIRVTDFNDEGSIDLYDIHYISKSVFEQIKNYTISTNDLYISIAGTIGKTGIIPEKLNGANLTENACKLVFKTKIDPYYVYYFTKSKDFLIQAGLNTRVTAMPKLALSRLETIHLRIPDSIEEQNQLVLKMNILSEKIRGLQRFYLQKLADLEELKKSLLQKAFEGEL
jgi:type I restriction enzyme S subunit